ncbi:hypothetical protein [Cognatiyoonia sp. IB215182]|uniref:hypothetical protein n=1 Tax=Cognatiyoonia sp. IB215182 TaxID=3097353 RepID=UPI002A147338|nr:hypothetical protein [Cognatiyoonia sp. IB215182]MDX8355546.1 hypothetical protein [Cognatiyoonia sp. IB215182]
MWNLLDIMLIVGAVLCAGGLALHFWWWWFYARKGVAANDSYIRVPGVEIPLAPAFVMIAVGVSLVAPRLYVEVVDRPPETVFAEIGYGLCEVKPYSEPANLGAEGIDDDTSLALEALVRPPGRGPEELARWSVLIGEILRRDAEVREALQSAILRSNYSNDTISIYCRAKDKPLTDMTAEEARVFAMINRAKGYSQ